MSVKRITDLKVGQSGRIVKFENEQLACKLLTFGLLPQTKITVVRKIPFGGAYYLKINGIRLAVRADEAKSIQIENTTE